MLNETHMCIGAADPVRVDAVSLGAVLRPRNRLGRNHKVGFFPRDFVVLCLLAAVSAA